MIAPKIAEPETNPLTAADRAGYRSPPTAMISGYTGPNAKPTRPNSTIDAGSDGTSTAETSASPATSAAVAANRAWSYRSPSQAVTIRPSARQPQNKASAEVASPIEAVSRKRTSQFETPTSDAT